MSHVTRNRSAWAACAAILALGSTGCFMVSPQHGQYIGRTSDKVLFAGATGVPGQNVLIQAKVPYQDVWETIADVNTVGECSRSTDANGTWYRWPAVCSKGYLAIPAKYWRPKTGGPPQATHQAEVRAIVPGEDEDAVLLNFKDGYEYDATTDVWDAWGVWGWYGESITVYGTLGRGR